MQSIITRYPQFRVYRNIICLEMEHPQGRVVGNKWWDQGFELNFTPYDIHRVEGVRFGLIQGSTREVLAARIKEQTGWVVINLARSDLPAMADKGFLDVTPLKLPEVWHVQYATPPGRPGI